MRLDRRLIGGRLALVSVLLGAVVACSWQGLRLGGDRDDTTLRLYIGGELQYMSDREIVETVQPHLGAGFFEIDLHALRGALEDLPWIAEASVHRRWPNAVVVRVTEHDPVALWGEASVLGRKGEIFTPPTDTRPSGLPVLDGPEGSATLLLDRLPTLQDALARRELRLTRLWLDGRGGWHMRLDHGVHVRLGKTDVDARLDRFIRHAVPALDGRLRDTTYVDMRYASGFAVGWRPADGAEEESDDQKA